MKNILFPALMVLLIMTGCGKDNIRETQSAPADASSAASAVSKTAPSSPPVSTSSEASAASGAENEDEQGQAQSEVSGDNALQTVKITVPEGYMLAKIAMTLEEKGICTVDEFITATQTVDFSEYPLIAEQQYDPNRCFKLEGYLFPDTYEVYLEDSPEAVIHRMLSNTEQKISDDLRADIAKSGYTTDQILTIASIIEREAFGQEQMGKISSVLHNRLDSGWQVQCDVTIVYVNNAIKPFITGDKDRYNDYYNTYKCAGLPPGAICNPGIDAIKAAINPEATDYMFFVTDDDKNFYYSVTYEEHLEHDKRIKLEKAETSGE